MLMFKSWQKPGAVTNCTIQEYRRGRWIKDTFVISVSDHKTGTVGTAKLLVEKHNFSKLQLYFDKIRPTIKSTENNLLLRSNGNAIKSIQHYLRPLGAKYNINIPTATQIRKAGATAVVLECSSKEGTLVSRQLSHSLTTDVSTTLPGSAWSKACSGGLPNHAKGITESTDAS